MVGDPACLPLAPRTRTKQGRWPRAWREQQHRSGRRGGEGIRQNEIKGGKHANNKERSFMPLSFKVERVDYEHEDIAKSSPPTLCPGPIVTLILHAASTS